MAFIQGTPSGETLNGTDDADTIFGAGGNDTINGAAGDDLLYGEDGDDSLFGDAGIDWMYGGAGWDRYLVDNSLDLVFEDVGGGRDTVNTSVDYRLPAGQEIENLSAPTSGGFALRLAGNEFNNTIQGTNGPDVISGGAGADRLFGWGGNDVFYVDSLDQVYDFGNEGLNDRIAALESFFLVQNADSGQQQIEVLEAITLSATNRIDLTGNSYTQIVAGNNGMNVLRGWHEIYGYGGDDYLAGNTSSTLIGGLGNDTYYFDYNAFSDAIIFPTIIELAGEGRDRVATNPDYTLPRGLSVEVLEIINSTSTYAVNLGGNELDNLIAGNNGINILTGAEGNDELAGYAGADRLEGGDGDDILNGGSGADVMIGGNGSDYYYVQDTGDTMTEAVAPGYDWLAAGVSFTLAAGVDIERFEPITFNSTAALDFTGNEFGTFIIGNNGSNFLNGRGGMDVLEGLGGSDYFVFDSALGAGNIDLINDFKRGADRILLDDAIFAAFTGRQMMAGELVVGPNPQAADSNDYVLYDSANGALYYDADGSGGMAAVQFASLSSGLSLSNSDFVII